LSTIKSKHLVKTKLSEDHSLDDVSGDFEGDDDDPLIAKNLFVSFIGIMIALMTILLPSASVLLGRPFSQGNEIIINQSIIKDGS